MTVARRTDFEWMNNEVVHTPRRTAILKKYPEIKKLMVADPNFKYQVTAFVLIQFVSLWLLKDAPWWVLLPMAYCFNGVINHSLSLAIHDICHNTAFGNARPKANRLFGIFANLPIGVPSSIAFKKYHLDHHRYQAEEEYDPDLPTEVEAKLFNSIWTKVIWVFLQPLFYAIRPVLVRPLPISNMEVLNIIVQITFDVIVVYTLGYHMVLYMIGSTILCMGLHPMSGHFISEHYMFTRGFETFSYYGPMNRFMFNVGYHMEHHDFPSIPSSKLPQVKEIAKDFYDVLPYHDSLTKVLVDFIFDPNISLYCRIKRKPKHLNGEMKNNNNCKN